MKVNTELKKKAIARLVRYGFDPVYRYRDTLILKRRDGPAGEEYRKVGADGIIEIARPHKVKPGERN